MSRRSKRFTTGKFHSALSHIMFPYFWNISATDRILLRPQTSGKCVSKISVHMFKMHSLRWFGSVIIKRLPSDYLGPS
jgi:hypothetical protein